MSTEIISDAEIAGFMGWRGPGAYTQHSLRKIKRIVEEVRVRTLDRAESETLSQLQQANDAISTALQALGPVAPDCCGCATEWQVAIDALTESHRHDGIPKGFRPHSERMAELRQDPKKAAALNRAKERLADPGKPMVDHPGNPTDMVDQIADCLVEDHIALMNENDELRRALGAKQAEIDRLMLEYCPSEMTPEQIAEWGANQKPITEAWHGQSNINSRFNACQHKEYCVQLQQRVTTTGETK